MQYSVLSTLYSVDTQLLNCQLFVTVLLYSLHSVAEVAEGKPHDQSNTEVTLP